MIILGSVYNVQILQCTRCLGIPINLLLPQYYIMSMPFNGVIGYISITSNKQDTPVSTSYHYITL